MCFSAQHADAPPLEEAEPEESAQANPKIGKRRVVWISIPTEHLWLVSAPPPTLTHTSTSHPPTTPKTPNEPAVSNGAPYPPPLPPVASKAPENALPDDELSKDLRGAWTSATTAPKVSKVDKVLLQVENGVTGAMEKHEKGKPIMEGIKTGLEVVGGMEAIEKGINSFMEGMPVLMNALDEVAKLHPFIGVAVMAFKAVWALEQKRRENDRRILALHMEMKNMMGVLTQLKNVQDAEEVAPDGTTIKGRMQELGKAVAEDIKSLRECMRHIFQEKTRGIFDKRRGEFEFALAIHTAVGVDQANRVINTVDETTQEMNAKMDIMMKMFAQFVTPEQKEMARLVEQRGGQAVLDNDKALKELNDWENKLQGAGAAHGGKNAKAPDLDDLKDDLHTDPDAAMEQNMVVFNRKFEVQTRQIIDEMSRVVERQGDRIISAVTAGPHDKIKDAHVHSIWKEMGWRGSVKSRHFVMALRDHFQEESSHKKAAEGNPEDHTAMVVEKTDAWTLEYINVVYLQAISEAFDDDASGFVTVAEVNTFTTMRPLDWSLPRWIAYWAIGHHQAMQIYANKISELLGKMFAILPKILPANKSSVNMYLDMIYRGVWSVVASLNPCNVNEALHAKFSSYIEAEETRIRGNLEAVQYDIDAPDTLELVTGEGRIERYVLPVMYLLLERHFEIFRVCQTRTVHPDELWDAGDTLQYVLDSVLLRLQTLQSIFKQQKLDLDQQFKGFAHGLYEYVNNPNLIWDAKLVQEAKLVEYSYDDSKEAQDIDVTKILNYPVDKELLDFDAYAPPPAVQPTSETVQTLPALAGVLGVWHGHMYWPATAPSPNAGMCTIELKPSSTDGDVQFFTASSRANGTDFNIAGKARAGATPGTLTISFKRSFPARYPAQYMTGTYCATTETLSGTYSFEASSWENSDSGSEKDEKMPHGAFIFRRIAPEYMCFAPAPVEGKTARALWTFAIGAVLFDVRRKGWSWSYFEQRRDFRRKFIELYIRGTKFGPPLTQEDAAEWSRVVKFLTTSDSRFYHSLADQQIRATTDHHVYCDNCRGIVGGARISCLVCQMKDTFNTVDFCSTPGCIENRVSRDDMQKAHQPHHDLMKVRRKLHTRTFGATYRSAKEALKHARTFFKTAQPNANAESDSKSGGGDENGSASDTEDEEGHTPVVQVKPVPTLAVTIPDVPRRLSMFLTSAVSAPPDAGFSNPPCSACNKPVLQPCWYCVQCAGATFICWECDAKDDPAAVAFGEHDFHTHDLVRGAGARGGARLFDGGKVDGAGGEV
ncbi:hypothetical protein MVEN_01784700 [Mycena venus]|uniref:Vacuolar protein sorting-associated protein 13 second N-terminal domain-containing protein n=1 Tax=Mycena venus TaxID=2733690 RepID=A0A8H6XK65_9AGAR|nr:hypothetical protein MVEN_01784700 [Mycena venus]